MYGVNLPTLFIVSVAGGVGQKALDLNGKVLAVGVIAPNTSAVYDMEILDVDGFGVCHLDDAVGNVSVNYGARFYGPHTVYFTNATDGDYKVKVWYE